ncbi:MAG: TonB C-terminal domain-containing protein [Zetaproteobacteria bacterium]|nr:TonB C-terminal domain-containing protein [Zetaproteobacteria bacterium]
MSLNLAADSTNQHTLKAADFLFAATVHVIVILLIVILTWWQSTSKPEPLNRIEVMMISGAELAKLQKQASKPVAKPRKMKPKAKPVLKFDPKPVKKRAPPREVEDDFDPFAPVESQSDITTPKKAARNDMAEIMGKQLSQKELDRYIAKMQQAVQYHWKVPAGVDSSIPDPLVEMVLRRNGSVVSARIVESSGNASLDQTLINAIHAAAPFEVPLQQFEAFRVNQIRFRPLK